MADQPQRPRLKQGETPQSASFQKRMKEFNRQVALAEVNKAKEEQDAREATERESRDVLTEVSTAVKQADEDAKPKAQPKKKTPTKKRIAESARSAKENRAAQIERQIEGED